MGFEDFFDFMCDRLLTPPLNRLLNRVHWVRVLKNRVVLLWAVASASALVGFWLYILRRLAADGLVYTLGNNAGWIGFDTHPIAFLLWSAVYCIPVLATAVMLLVQAARRRAQRRAAFRQFTDGLGPPPTVRIIDLPAARRDKPGPGS
jgi:hypothetical protein